MISNSLVSRDSLHHKTGEIHLETSKMREKQRKKTRKTEKKSFSTRSRARAAVKGRERRSVWTRVDPRLFEERISTPSSSPLSHAFRSLKSGRNPLGTTRNAQKPRWLKKEQKRSRALELHQVDKRAGDQIDFPISSCVPASSGFEAPATARGRSYFSLTSI